MNERTFHSLAQCPKLGISALEREVAGFYLPVCEQEDRQKTRDVSQPSKPFAAFGSFRQRHGDVLERNYMRTIEAPAKLESGTGAPRGGLSQAFSLPENERNAPLDNSMGSVDCDGLAMPETFEPPHPHRKAYHKGKSSTDFDREEAWERKKEQYLLQEEEDDGDDGEEYDADEGVYDEFCEKGASDESSCGSVDEDILHEHGKDNDKHNVEYGDGNSDGVRFDVAGGDEEHIEAVQEDGVKKLNRRTQFSRRKSFTRRPVKPLMRTRTKSLTDEDMEELRGSIDLGFGFSYSERCNLKSTLPALELYYAINKNYVDAQSRSSPVSPLDGNALVRTNSAGSTLSPSSDTWRISSPGDHPTQVKTRLRHWAQAVACSVKQGY